MNVNHPNSTYLNSSYPNSAYSGGGLPPRVNFGWISEAVALYKTNLGLWLSATLLGSFAPFLFTTMVLVSAKLPAHLLQVSGLKQPIGLYLGLVILNALYSAYVLGGIYNMAVKQVRGEPIGFGTIFSGGPLAVPMLGLLLIANFAISLGLSLLLVPGVVIAGLLLPSFAMVADRVSLGDALRRSVRAMNCDRVSAAGFAFVLGLLVLASALPFGLGLLVTLPLCWLLSALAYRDMVGFPALPLADDLPNGLPRNAEITLSAGEPRLSLTGELLDSDGNVVSENVPVTEAAE